VRTYALFMPHLEQRFVPECGIGEQGVLCHGVQ